MERSRGGYIAREREGKSVCRLGEKEEKGRKV